MIERTATIGSPVGLHARPAKLFTKAVAAAGFPVTLTWGDSTINARSILALLALGVQYGDTVTLRAEDGSNENELAELADMLARNLDEA